MRFVFRTSFCDISVELFLASEFVPGANIDCRGLTGCLRKGRSNLELTNLEPARQLPVALHNAQHNTTSMMTLMQAQSIRSFRRS